MRRPPRIAVLIAVLAATAAWVAFDLRSTPAPGSLKPAVPGAEDESQGAAKTKQPGIPPRATLGRIASDPFSVQSWLPPRKPAAAPSAPPPPVAPPLPYRFAGQFYRDSGSEVYVGRGEEIFPVKEGETLDGQYKVESISLSEVRFLHLPTGTSQIMQFSALREQELAAKAEPAQPKAPASGPASPATVAKTGPAQLRWEGPKSARAGTNFDVALRVTSGEQIRAAPMQVRFDPAILESVSVRP